ncbi:methylenetetrahydrofolate reductase [Desulfopila aestuarii]|uniref:Methylenetetrahydrofolate reductase n=1 Tax=Desulfopila aestuarii DSM 18488 TaxID=1121416 RepID=A0A1M7Y3M7_9BACT|nr:methylenetetrahydrofolate reductase [Desulfopila aestuarii]SHO46641.1 5,10-methylenetetrahydrofolate reductase [Desulfopila aestuarii DSM 18488]
MHDAHESPAPDTPPTSFKIIAELDPPKGTNIQPFLDTALQLKGRIDAVRVTDSEHAIMRMAPYAPCLSLMENHINPIMVINGRDRNRISFQADLLAASALGIREITIKKGHDPAEGDQPVTRSSGDLDLQTMIKSVAALNGGNDLGGEPLDGSTAFSAGVEIELTDNSSANRQLAETFSYMADNGIKSVTLGPTYDLNIIDIFLPAAEKTGLKLYTSIMFLKSVTMVKYLNNLPGVPSVPQEFLKKMMNAPVKRDAGMEIASDLYRDLATLGNGTVLLSIGLRERLPDFLSMIGR